MAISYDTLGSTVTIYPSGTVAPSQLNTSVAIVGGYDSANAGSSVTEGEATVVTSGTEAETAFGTNSELAYQVGLALQNGASEVHGVPLPETTTTETFGSSTATDSGTLSNAPVMDPNVQPDEDITAQDVTASTSVTVNIVYADSPSAPSGSNEINLNPINGAWTADDTSEYDITYTYGDFSTAIKNAVDQTVRYTAVCSEADSSATTAQTELDENATNFRFGRAVLGSAVDIPSANAGTYTPAVEDWRLVEVAPSRGTDTDGNSVRTVGAIAGLLARQPIDVSGSITYDYLEGFDSLRQKYAPTTAEQFSQVTSITDEFEVAQGVTTSAESAFSDVYKTEIIDLIVELLYDRVKDFAGGSNAQSARRLFKSRLKRLLASYSVPEAQPPLLASGDGTRPYSVTVKQGSTDTETDVNVGIDVAPIAKEVTLDVSVGPIRFNGASV